MKKDLGLVGDEYSWVGSIFYSGFLAFEWPAAILIQTRRVAKLLAGLVLCWAVPMCCSATAQNFAGLATVRFINGMYGSRGLPNSKYFGCDAVLTILMLRLPRKNQTGLTAASFVFFTYWGIYVMSTSLPMANVTGHTKR